MNGCVQNLLPEHDVDPESSGADGLLTGCIVVGLLLAAAFIRPYGFGTVVLIACAVLLAIRAFRTSPTRNRDTTHGDDTSSSFMSRGG